MSNNVVWRFLKNLCVFFRCDIYKDIAELKYQQKVNSEKLWTVDTRELLFEIMMYYDVHKDEASLYREELQFLKQHGLCIFPYNTIKESKQIELRYEEKSKMTYVIHKGKRLYFPIGYSQSRIASIYHRLLEQESITGDGILAKCPHQYCSDIFKVEEGDILIDIGCAEALLALDVIEKVKKAYLIESDLCWMPALKATFAPYKDKVVFVNKLVADSDSDSSITLSTLLKEESDSSLFIKMDIEGYENQVIASSKTFLKNHNKAKLACCTYHKEGDANALEQLFHSYGYKTEYSDGYILFLHDDLTSPYFRKGIIRAYKI